VSWSQESYLRAVTIGEPSRADGPITLVEYDPEWPAQYEQEAARILAALGDRELVLEHAGSTSVPGLAAKPIIDIVLGVADPTDEDAYVSDLESAGFVLHIREPDFQEHRMFKGNDPAVNLHVFAAESPEIVRMVAFRERLRMHDDERALYAATKRELAARRWTFVQEYADAKSEVVEAITGRALADAR
jgi:GrpB-like predicted nucleotidyltransferase (UPF0157 family)